MKRSIAFGGSFGVWHRRGRSAAGRWVKQVQVLMKGNGHNAGALAAMVKGDKPYDQATVDAALAQLDDTVKKLPTLFPDSAKGLKPEGDSSGLAEGLGGQGRFRSAHRGLREGRDRGQGRE